jgi:hypothetical protein
MKIIMKNNRNNEIIYGENNENEEENENNVNNGSNRS